MTMEDRPSGTTATIVATAAVTLALGITVAAFGGYLAPDRERQRDPRSAVAPAPQEAKSGAGAEAPSVVLVPVSQERRGPQEGIVPVQPQPEVVLAAREPPVRQDEDDQGHHHARGHGEHEREHDDD